MNTTGTSRALRAICCCRPIRCCRAEKGSGRSPRNASTSPSRTTPSGRAAAASATSGKRSVISSSPRDHRCSPPSRLHQLRADAVPLPFDQPVGQVEPALRPSHRPVACARQNGYGRDRSASVPPGESSDSYDAGDGVHSPMSRAAIVVAGSPAVCARARTTSVCETPTRSSPVSSFSSVKRSHRASALQPPDHLRLLLERLQSSQRQDALFTHAASVRSSDGSDGS